LEDVEEHRRQEDTEQPHAEHPGEHGSSQRRPHLDAGPTGDDLRHDAEDVIVFEVNVPARWLRHSPRRGLWYVRRDVPPARLRRLLHFDELAASPPAA
jgi:hypothetical protein